LPHCRAAPWWLNSTSAACWVLCLERSVSCRETKVWFARLMTTIMCS